MFKIKNHNKVLADIDKWMADVEAEYLRIAVALMRMMLSQSLKYSPQYSGDFAANWNLSVNLIDVTFNEGVFPSKRFPVPDGQEPFQRGDAPAISYAFKANDGKLGSAKLGDTLWLANSAAHHDLYAWKIEDNLIKLRPVNFGGEGPLGKVKAHMLAHFSRIDKSNVEFLR